MLLLLLSNTLMCPLFDQFDPWMTQSINVTLAPTLPAIIIDVSLIYATVLPTQPFTFVSGTYLCFNLLRVERTTAIWVAHSTPCHLRKTLQHSSRHESRRSQFLTRGYWIGTGSVHQRRRLSKLLAGNGDKIGMLLTNICQIGSHGLGVY